MISLVIYLLVYIAGGLTLLPAILFFCWYFYGTATTQLSSTKDNSSKFEKNNNDDKILDHTYDSKRGWIRLMTVKNDEGDKNAEFEKTSTEKNANPFFPPSSSFTIFFAILRGGTLFCFDDELQATCHWIIPVRNYNISLYPKKGKAEAELFGRSMSISLSPKPNANNNDPTITYYTSCERPIDKEDWYFALTLASHYTLDDNSNNNNQRHDNSTTTTDTTLFDPWAMTALQGSLNSETSAQMDTQCWNALLGRLFLGIYKTEKWRHYWHTKMINKLEKINNYHQHPLQQLVDIGGGGKSTSSSGKRSLMRLLPLQLEHMSMGDTMPYLTDAQLVEFTSDGTCVIQAQLDYTGDFLVVLRTGLYTLWRPPTSLLSPFGGEKKNNTGKKDPIGGGSSLPLVLSLKLRHCSGKVVFKIKSPPTCRVWAAFETMPTLEWQVTPVVLDKQIKWSYVTHLLQTKIKELVAESLVLPNMEDFPFYDSGGLGGIFGHDDPAPYNSNTSTTTSTEEKKGTTTLNDKDSGIDVDITKDDNDDKQQPPPMVSTLVEGYMDRIRNPHKYTSTLDTTTATNL